MLPILTAAVVAFTTATPTNTGNWFTAFGMHPKENKLTLVSAEIGIDAHGVPKTCEAKTILGIESWAPFTCRLIMARASFKPATVDGQKTYGVFRLRVPWTQSRTLPEDLPVWDFEITLSKAPADVKLPLLKKLKFVVDQAGQITSCAASGDWSAQLATFACGELRKLNLVYPARTNKGAPVQSVQDVVVKFVGAKAEQSGN